MNDNPLSALAMRERAAAYMENPTHQGIRPTWASDVRTLPTTFTDAELLAAAMQLPEVRALVEAGQMFISGYTDQTDLVIKAFYDMETALAPFMKGAS